MAQALRGCAVHARVWVGRERARSLVAAVVCVARAHSIIKDTKRGSIDGYSFLRPGLSTMTNLEHVELSGYNLGGNLPATRTGLFNYNGK